MPHADIDRRLSLHRWYPAPAERVFRAFTEPVLLESWFCPAPDVTLQVSRLDLRVGGAYRFLFHFPDGARAVIGKYRIIDRPRELAFTWTWEPPDEYAGVETLVRILFSERDGGTDVLLTHSRFPDEPRRTQHDLGWRATLDRLCALLDRSTQP